MSATAAQLAASQPGGELAAERAQPQPSAPMMIAVDAMGGDHAPEAIVAGAVAAARDLGTSVALTGRPGLLRPLLTKYGPAPGVYIEPAEDSIAMDEGALASWRRPRSSIAVACQLVRRGQAGAVMSAGSTGAIVATAQMRLRPLPGVTRPALAVAWPTRPTPTLLIDAGAIADPKPEMLVQFAQLGVAYAQTAFGIVEPRVGLLTIGSEPGKGNKLARRSYELLNSDPPHGGMPISFAGNVEGDDLLAGRVDVIVTDGFTGNVALKTLEGTASYAAAQLRAALGGSRAARIGTLFQRRGLRELTERLDSETYGGAAMAEPRCSVWRPRSSSRTERRRLAARRLRAGSPQSSPAGISPNGSGSGSAMAGAATSCGGRSQPGSWRSAADTRRRLAG